MILLNKHKYPDLTPAQLANFRADIAKHPAAIAMNERFGGGIEKAVEATCRLVEKGLLEYKLKDDGHLLEEACVYTPLVAAVGLTAIVNPELGMALTKEAVRRANAEFTPRRPN